MVAWIKKLLRLAGLRAPNGEPLEPLSTEAHNPAHGLETDNQALARPPAARAGADSLGTPAAQGGTEHGLRGRAGGTHSTALGSRVPRHAARTIESGLAALSYGELAPHLARNVLRLRNHHGPFRLAYLEALLRVADWRALREEDRMSVKGNQR